MTEVEVVLVELSGILHDVIKGILDAQPEIEVVADLDSEDLVNRSIRETGAQFVIWGVDGDVTEFYPQLLDRHPQVKVLAVQSRHHNTLLWEMRPTRSALGALTRASLLTALRPSERA